MPRGGTVGQRINGYTRRRRQNGEGERERSKAQWDITRIVGDVAYEHRGRVELRRVGDLVRELNGARVIR